MSRFVIPGMILIAELALASVSGQTAKKPRLDGRGDPLPPGALARLGTQRWRIGESPLLFTSDGRRAIAVGYRLRLIDVTTGNRLRTFDINAQSAFLMPDDKTLIVLGDEKGGAAFLDIESGKVLRRLPVEAHSGTWSANGKRMASVKFDAKYRPTLTVWNMDTGKAVHVWDQLRGDILLSPDGATLAVRQNENIQLFDAVKGNELRRWKCGAEPLGRTSQAKILVFSPNGRILATTQSSAVGRRFLPLRLPGTQT